MLYKTLKNETFRADRGILLYIMDGKYIVRLANFGNEMEFFSREAFEAWLDSPRCIMYTKVRKAA